MDNQTPNPSQTLNPSQTPNPSPITGIPVYSRNSHPVEENIDTSKLTTVVWGHFLKIRTIGGDIKAKCKYCQQELAGNSNNGTTHLKTHMGNCIQRKIYDRSQKILGPDVFTDATGKRELKALTYNPEVSRKQLGLAIVMHDYPLSIVEHYYTRNFLKGLQPKFRVLCRTTIRKEILNMYALERVKVNKRIDDNIGRIAITTDMCTTTTQKKGYMYVTAHYIDNN
ncbi:Putative AC9 transposase [Linum perenne]